MSISTATKLSNSSFVSNGAAQGEKVEQSREANLGRQIPNDCDHGGTLATSFISAWVRDASRASFPLEKEADVTYGPLVKGKRSSFVTHSSMKWSGYGVTNM
jgi:hypothetical protein